MSIKKFLLSLFGRDDRSVEDSVEFEDSVESNEDEAEDSEKISYTKELVLKKARETFPSEDTAKVISALNDYGIDSHERERERVQIAILKLSEGDLKKLAKYVKLAKSDYRDVLAPAEYPLERKSATWKMEKDALKEIRQKDREQYLAWLNGSDT